MKKTILGQAVGKVEIAKKNPVEVLPDPNANDEVVFTYAVRDFKKYKDLVLIYVDGYWYEGYGEGGMSYNEWQDALENNRNLLQIHDIISLGELDLLAWDYTGIGEGKGGQLELLALRDANILTELPLP